MKKLLTLLSTGILLLSACTKQGPIGATGSQGATGKNGSNGTNGMNGVNGANGTTVTVKTYTNQIVIPPGTYDTLLIPQITQAVIDTGTIIVQTSQLYNRIPQPMVYYTLVPKVGMIILGYPGSFHDTLAVVKVTIIP